MTPILPLGARIYLAAVIFAGAGVLMAALTHWESGDINHFWGYLALVMIAATWKIRLPNLSGTLSPAYVVVLIAIARLGFAETVVLAGVGAVVQSLWRPTRPPLAIQVAFNLCSSMIGTALAFGAARELLPAAAARSLLALLLIATLVQYTVTSVLVALAVCLTEGRPVWGLWRLCNFWAFPHYAVGATSVGLTLAARGSLEWAAPACLVGVLLLLRASYRVRLKHG